FDEPTSALDRSQVERFFDILRRLKSEGRAIVFISHRMDEIFSIGDRVTVIRDGETVATSNIAETDPSAVIRQMVGGESELAASAPPLPASDTGAAALGVEALTGAGFRDVSLTVGRGEVLGFGGLHGQ